MRVVMARGETDFPIEVEWSDYDGYHSKRVTEEMPDPIKAHAAALMDWANAHSAQVLKPQSEAYQEERRIREEVRKLHDRLKVLGKQP